MIKLHASPSNALSGRAGIPGDKSISHRALILSAMAVGQSTITGLLEAEDVIATARALNALGVGVQKDDKRGIWYIDGVGPGGLGEPGHVLNMGNAGTAARLLIGLVASHHITCFFDGDESLIRRPMDRVITPLTAMGARFTARSERYLPLCVQGSDMTMPITYTLPVPSAQVKSAILLSGLNTQGTTRVIESTPTRDHTELIFSHFGLDVQHTNNDNGETQIGITGQQDLIPANLHVPRDPSAAAFVIVAALITKDSAIEMPGLCLNVRRTGLFAVLEEMGAVITYHNRSMEAGEEIGDVYAEYTPGLKGVTVPETRISDMIDEIPVLCVAAAFADGTTHIEGLDELRHKESDRLATTYDMLTACGVQVEAGENSLTIYGNGEPPTGGVEIDSAGDHRIAMAAAVLGLGAKNSVTVANAGAIATSFPDFVNIMKTAGANIKE